MREVILCFLLVIISVEGNLRKRKSDIVPEWGDECKGDETTMKDCNHCMCSAGWWACTKKRCIPPEIIQQIRSRKRKSDMVPQLGDECKGDETTMKDCNHCMCSGGWWACTKKRCIPPEIIQQIRSRKRKSDMVPQLGDECKGDETTMKDCNHCMCSGGWWACTKKRCIPPEIIQQIRSRKRKSDMVPQLGDECKGDETTMKDCNYCMCSGGWWACTKKRCIPPEIIQQIRSRNRKSDMVPVVPNCKPGDKTIGNDGCTECTCREPQEIGWKCSTLPCHKSRRFSSALIRRKAAHGRHGSRNRNKHALKGKASGNAAVLDSCHPGQVKHVDCNYCSCSSDGIWVCTLNHCRSGGRAEGLNYNPVKAIMASLRSGS